MNLKRVVKELPVLPTTALIFYLFVVLLWNLNLIPPPTQIVAFLESLYNSYGLIGLAIATFLEGIVYLGLYFPGSFIIALAVFFSGGSFFSLLSISIVVAITLTITSFINYFLGRHVSFRKDKGGNFGESKKASKGLIASSIHPNILAFYFFTLGLERKSVWKVVWVPVIMVPLGLFYAYLLYSLRFVLKEKLESPWFLFVLIVIWLAVAFIVDHRRKVKRQIIEFEKSLK